MTSSTQVHSSYSTKRLDIAVEFLEALDACRRAQSVEAAQEARRLLDTARTRARLVFATDPDVLAELTDASLLARSVLDTPRPPAYRVPQELEELRDRAAWEEGGEGPAHEALALLACIREEQGQALAKGEPAPDGAKYEYEMLRLGDLLGLSLWKAAPDVAGERRQQEQARRHNEAVKRLAAAEERFIKATHSNMHSPVPVKRRRWRRR